MSELLAQKFLKEMGGQELWAPIHNAAPLVQTSGFTLRKRFEKYYSDTHTFPVLVSIKDGVGIMYIPLTKTKSMAAEFCTKALANRGLIGELEEWQRSEEAALRAAYPGAHTTLEAFVDRAWEYNAKFFFALGFDKETCDPILKLSSKAWELVLQVPIVSIDKRHGWEVARLVGSGLMGSELYSACQHLFTNFSYSPTLAEVPALLERDFADYMSPAGPQLVGLEQKQHREQLAAYTSELAALAPQEQKAARIVNYAMRLRDERKDILLMLSAAMFRAARAALQQAGQPEELAPYLLVHELNPAYLREHAGDIAERVKGFDVYVSYDGEIQTDMGHTAENRKVVQDYFAAQTGHTTQPYVLRGATASPGYARGRVKVVLNVAQEAAKFEEGDILVAGMTRPEYVFLMKKAGAIVTDEGGITCHAAIVSRELGKPCVIATKVATQVLKDGDMVEVDADKGVVRKIDHA